MDDISSASLEDHHLLENVAWMDSNWMFLSLICGMIVLFWLFSTRWLGSLAAKFQDPVWCAFLAVPVYSVHQFEEHGYDIFGRRYMFLPVFNAGAGTRTGLVMYPRAATIINVFAIWVIFPLWAHLASKKNNWYPATLPWGVAVINGLTGHLVPFFIEKDQGIRYVPGAVQSLFMVPLGLWILLSVFKKHGVMLGAILPLVIGVIWHVVGLMMPVILLTSVADVIRIPIFIAIASLVPVLLTSTLVFQDMLSQADKNRIA